MIKFNNYKIQKRGDFYFLLDNNKVLYKSKTQKKVQSRYDGLMLSKENQLYRQTRARYFF